MNAALLSQIILTFPNTHPHQTEHCWSYQYLVLIQHLCATNDASAISEAHRSGSGSPRVGERLDRGHPRDARLTSEVVGVVTLKYP